MIGLRKFLKVLPPSQDLRRTWRTLATQANMNFVRALREAKEQTYENHPHLLFSSHLEDKCMEQLKGSRGFTRLGDQKLYKSAEPPTGWMHDYEFYEGAMDEDGNVDATYGTANATVPPSKVPCSGCGAHLHCAKVSLPGYIPYEIFNGRSKNELQTIVCQRCYFLEHYNIALDVEVKPDTYVATIARIQDKFALAVVIVDLTDVPCSIWPGLPDVLGRKRPVIIVGNKVDLLPRDSKGYLERVKQCLYEQVLESGFDRMNVKHIGLISAKTGYGVEELITQLHNIWRYKGDVYLVGCTNVGKSSLFNMLLNSDYCRPQASKLVRKATTCPWPGTTLQMLKFPILRPSEIRVYDRFRRLFSERGQKAADIKLRSDQAKSTGSVRAATLIGDVRRTPNSVEERNDPFVMSSGIQPIISLNERSAEYKQARWCYDTPGVMHPAQITNLLTTEELLMLEAKQMLTPRAYRLPVGSSLFLAGLARLDLVECQRMQHEWIKVVTFSTLQLPITIVRTADAEQVYAANLGTELFGVPFGGEERLARWPGLQLYSESIIVRGTEAQRLSCDIVLSSAGWIGLCIPNGEECRFEAWTPHARGIFVRTPPLVPFAEMLVGKRMRDSLAYNLSKPFVFTK